MTRRRWLAAALAALTMALFLGCSIMGDDVQTKTEDEVKALVRERGMRVAELIGGEPVEVRALNPGPCTGKFGESNREIFAVQGSFEVPLAADKQLETLARLKATWKAEGYTITDDRQFSDREGILVAVAKPEEYTIRVLTPPEARSLGILVYSPCFKSPTPR